MILILTDSSEGILSDSSWTAEELSLRPRKSMSYYKYDKIYMQ
jgi:hypothetical protein